MKHIVLELENIDCEGCANSIRRALLRQPDILSVHVEVSSSRVNLLCEDDVDRMHVLSVLENLGYTTLGRNSMLSIARARMNCQMGKIRHVSYYQTAL